MCEYTVKVISFLIGAVPIDDNHRDFQSQNGEKRNAFSSTPRLRLAELKGTAEVLAVEHHQMVVVTFAYPNLIEEAPPAVSSDDPSSLSSAAVDRMSSAWAAGGGGRVEVVRMAVRMAKVMGQTGSLIGCFKNVCSHTGTHGRWGGG